MVLLEVKLQVLDGEHLRENSPVLMLWLIIQLYLIHLKYEDIENDKKSIISGIRSIDDEQDTEITYFFGQEITNEKISTEEYIKNISFLCKGKFLLLNLKS